MKIENTITTRMISFILLVLILILASCKSIRDKQANTAYERDYAAGQIIMLKGNTLLIRLKTAESKILKLEQLNNHDQAKAEQEKIEIFNKDLIEAFRDKYTFSDVYFFRSDYSLEVKNKVFDKLELIDINNEVVTNNQFLEDGYLVGMAERGIQHELLVIKDAKFEDVKFPIPTNFFYQFSEELDDRKKRLKQMKTLVKNIDKTFNNYYKRARKERYKIDSKK